MKKKRDHAEGKKEDKGPREIIRLENVSKFYGEGHSLVKAVDGITVSVREGEFVAIMGPSGSGKSTSMNMVGSLDVPTKGRIFLDSIDIGTLEESELAQIRGKKIGFIFQQFNLIPNLTALENVMLPILFQGMEEEDRIERAEKLLGMVKLEHRIDHYPNQLSGGEQQRVAIARSLANDPDVLLADEPTGNLDTKTGNLVLDFLNDLNSQGKTIVMITHDPDLAREHADVIFWIKDGKVEKTTKKFGKTWKKIPSRSSN
jgi:putative ABC transport system ATP-binding protein